VDGRGGRRPAVPPLLPPGCTLPALLAALAARLPAAGYTALDAPALTDLGAALAAGPVAAGDLVVGGGLSATALAAAVASKSPTLTLTPSPSLWRATVGLADGDLGASAPSPALVDTLEAVAAARSRGALRTELAAARGVDARNFHFVVTHLLARRLLSSTPVLIPPSRGKPVQSTARLHVPRFAPVLGRGQVLREGPGAGAAGGVRDDHAAAASVCARLQAIAPAATPDADLKRMLALPAGQPGNRAWRRLRGLLVDAGHARCVSVSVGGKAEKAALVAAAPWDDGASLAAVVEGRNRGRAAGDPAPGADGAPLFELTAEHGLDAQLLRMLAAAGADGVPAPDVARAFGSARAKSRLDAAKAAHGVVETSRQLGKAVMRVWTLGGADLAAARAAAPPPRPAGGFLAAVAAAAVAGMPPPATPVVEQAVLEAAADPPPATPPTERPGGTAAAPAGADLPLPPAAPALALNPSEEAELDDVVAEAVFEVEAAADPGDRRGGTPRGRGRGRGRGRAAFGATSTPSVMGPQHEARLRLIAAAVARDGFLPKLRVPRLVAAAEAGVAGARLDRRTMGLIVCVGAARGDLGAVRVCLPYSRAAAAGGGAGGAPLVATLLVPATAVAGLSPGDAALLPPDVQRAAVRAVFFGFRDDLRRARGARRGATPDTAMEVVRTAPAGASVPPSTAGSPEPEGGVAAAAPAAAATATLAPPRDRVAADLRTMLANGYARGALRRAAVLHDWLLAHAAAGAGGARARAAPAPSAPAAVGGVSFPLDAALDACPLGVVRAAVGCKGELGGAESARAHDRTPLASLPPALSAAARDAASDKRLDAGLQLLRRLGLVRLHLAPTGGTAAPHRDTRVAVLADVTLVVPAESGGDEGGALDAARFDLAAPGAAAALWAALASYAAAPAAAVDASPLAARVPELGSGRAWVAGREGGAGAAAATPRGRPAAKRDAAAAASTSTPKRPRTAAPKQSRPTAAPPSPPRAPSPAPAPPARKVRWTEDEDRALLTVYVAHVAEHGAGGSPALRGARRLPGTAVEERQGARRLDRLRKDGATAAMVASLDAAIDALRAAAGGPAGGVAGDAAAADTVAPLIDAIVDAAPLRPAPASDTAGPGRKRARGGSATGSRALRAPTSPASPAALAPLTPAPACFEDDAGEAVLAARTAAADREAAGGDSPRPSPAPRRARAGRPAPGAPRGPRAVASLEALRCELHARGGRGGEARAATAAAAAVDAAFGAGAAAAAAAALAAAGHAGRGGRGLSEAYAAALAPAGVAADVWHEAAAVASALARLGAGEAPRVPAPLSGPLAVLAASPGGSTLESAPGAPFPAGALALAAGGLADGDLATLRPLALQADAWDGGLALAPGAATTGTGALPPSTPAPRRARPPPAGDVAKAVAAAAASGDRGASLAAVAAALGGGARARARASAALAAAVDAGKLVRVADADAPAWMPVAAAGPLARRAPWSRADGAPHAALWRALARRATAAVLASPGLPEDAAVAALGALCPQSARAALAALEAAGVLISARPAPCAAPGPPTLLTRVPPPARKRQRCYFVAAGGAVARAEAAPAPTGA